ncbi:MAG: putative metal-binding motif-containing protein [Patescibacteria group bacterium]
MNRISILVSLFATLSLTGCLYGPTIDEECVDGEICNDDVDNDGDGWTVADGDCDDDDKYVHPGADEACHDGEDNDCDGWFDAADAECYDAHTDADHDGYYADEDCDDYDADVHPGATEICDGDDNDCDGVIDEGNVCEDEPTSITCYRDEDGDDYGNPDESYTFTNVTTCPPGWVENDDDCNDDYVSVYPGATELDNGRDDDCDGTIDEGFEDTGDEWCWYPYQEYGTCSNELSESLDVYDAWAGYATISSGDSITVVTEVSGDFSHVCFTVDEDESFRANVGFLVDIADFNVNEIPYYVGVCTDGDGTYEAYEGYACQTRWVEDSHGTWVETGEYSGGWTKNGVWKIPTVIDNPEKSGYDCRFTPES